MEVTSFSGTTVTPAVTDAVSGLLGGVAPGPSPRGLGVGSILVPVGLIVLFGYLYILEVSERENRELRRMLVAAAVPLAIVFTGIIVYSL